MTSLLVHGAQQPIDWCRRLPTFNITAAGAVTAGAGATVSITGGKDVTTTSTVYSHFLGTGLTQLTSTSAGATTLTRCLLIRLRLVLQLPCWVVNDLLPQTVRHL